MKMIAFMKYGSQAASTRQRLLQYIPHLSAAGIEVEWFPLLADSQIGRTRQLRNLGPILIAYLRRLALIARVRRYDLVWVHKEIFPYAPGAVEGLVARLGTPVVYDFDDAIFHNYDMAKRRWVRTLLGARFERLLGSAAAVSCGNAYLQSYAARFCDHSVVIPTTIDTGLYRPAARARTGPPVIGWIGSPSTWDYMPPLVPLLEDLVRSDRARVRIVGAGIDPDAHPAFEMVDWHEDTEIAQVQSMDIGIMPLTDDPWSRGKCGYKLIQYMACGLPVVASPVGVNSDLVRPGGNGMLASTIDEWRAALERLLADEALRGAYGAVGRSIVEQRYSLESQAPRLIELLRKAAGHAA